MRAWQLAAGASSLDDLRLIEMATPAPGPGEVLIRVHACSLNFRDQMIVRGEYMGGPVPEAITPLSDGAGEVVAVGDGVARFAVGDRVAGIFFQGWHSGPPVAVRGGALGAAGAPGMLAEHVVLPESGIIAVATSLDFDEAATLPCAGVTAWNALMEGPNKVGPGRSVLVIGTGGVSLIALQIAKAAGATVIATSSSDEKLERVRSLGADHLINYRTTPEWGAKAAELAGGGVDHVIEVGGAGTLAQSIAAVGYGGEVSIIGVLTIEGDTSPRGLMYKGASLRGIFVGSGAMATSLNAMIDAAGIKPVIGRRFGFDEVKDAFAYVASPDLFGKAVITF